MSLILKDRVRETTAVTGTGPATLLGAVTGYQAFSVVGNTNTCYYTIADQSGPNWEVGIGTYSTTGPTLARTTVLASSNGGSAVNFTSGTKDVFLTYPSENAVYTSNGPGTSGYVLVSAGAGAASVWTAPTSVVGGAGGSNTQVQFNSSGSLAGSANLTWDGTSFSATNHVATGSITSSSSKGVYSYGTLSYSDVNHILTMQSSQNSYIQMEVQNTNTGTAASADVVVGNNNTTASTYYGDFGMNSSGWTGTPGTNSFGAPNMVYLTATTGDLLLGTTTANPIRFATNGGADAMYIDTSGNVGIGTSSPSVKLQVSGTTGFVGAGYYQTAGGAGVYGTNLTYYSGGGDLSMVIGNSGSGYFYQRVTSNHALAFGTNNAERMRIDSSGNVGIGTTTPTNKVDILTADNTGLVVRSASFAGSFVPSTVVGGMAITTNGAYPLGFYLNGAERMRIDSSGNVIIGSTSYNLTTNNTQIGSAGIANNTLNGFNIALNKPAGDPQNAYQTFFWAGGLVGYIAYNGSGVSYLTTSDARLKENVKDSADALSTVSSIKVRSYDWIDSEKHDDFGFVAQELYEVYPKAVTEQKDKEDGSMDMPWGVDYSKLVPVLVKAMQEQQSMIDELKAEVDALKGKA